MSKKTRKEKNAEHLEELNINEDFNSVIEKASFVLIDNKEFFLIKTKFKIIHKANFGVLLILLISTILSFFFILNAKNLDLLTLLFGLTLSLPFCILSILTILKQNTDYVKVTGNEIQFRNSLRKNIFQLSQKMKLKIDGRTEYIKLRGRPFSGSYFRIIEIYLIHQNEEYRIFDFQVDRKDTRAANKLGNALMHKIKNRIKTIETFDSIK